MQLWTLSSGLWMSGLWLWTTLRHTLTDSDLSHTSQTLLSLVSLPGNDSFGWPYTETAGAGRGARGWPPSGRVACLFSLIDFKAYIIRSVIGVFSPLVRFSTHARLSHTQTKAFPTYSYAPWSQLLAPVRS